MLNNYNSVLVTLKDLVEGNNNENIEKDIKFNIPIYQRLYVWKDDQVKRLLEDTFGAFEKEKNNDYYLGGVIVVKNGDRYDLIDGQQRFTTLWLIAQYLKESLEPFLKDRMYFSIREHANNFFKDIGSLDDKDDELKNIRAAILTIKVFFEHKTENGKAFSAYLFEKVKLVFTTVPNDVDLNKLFETINSGGVQLQHHELLKAKMLKQIKDTREQKIYSKLWDSSAFMDNYIENNLAVALNCTKTDIFSNLYAVDGEKLENFNNIDRVLYFISQKIKGENQDKKSLKDILNEPEIKEQAAFNDKNKEIAEGKENEIKVRSIIGFSMLLLHTLRIFFKQEDKNDIKEVNENELLNIFTNIDIKYGVFNLDEDENSEKQVKKFINLLWRVRFAFDEHIIKWVNVDDKTDEVHMICKIVEYNGTSPSLQRDETELSKSFSLLQSMLYHTQEVKTHYWLTPLLFKLIDNNDDNEEYLQCLDNYLFFPKKDGDLRRNTWNLLINENYDKANSESVMKQFDLIEGNDYRQFSHYLFYKVEYILWFLQDNKQNDFYLRAKNSVEHIEPQTKDGDKNQENEWTGKLLDTFGNLALVSRERNSEFGNLTFKEKKAKFEAFKDSTQHLKMSLIYSNDTWDDRKCIEHLNEIKKKIEEYMKREK
jgi:hypothetical protein